MIMLVSLIFKFVWVMQIFYYIMAINMWNRVSFLVAFSGQSSKMRHIWRMYCALEYVIICFFSTSLTGFVVGEMFILISCYFYCYYFC